MARKYFGTDGMRGEANKDLTIDLVTDLGLALGYYLKKNKKGDAKPKIILGTDTRISGYMIRSALTAGLNSMGINIDFVGVLPTPGVCYLTRKLNADAGIMISASHNPVKDNGIKIFSQNGYKLPDEVEELRIIKDSDFVTLLTCTPFGVNDHRLLVRGHRIDYDFSQQHDSTVKLLWWQTEIFWPLVILIVILIILVWVFIKFFKKRKKKK